MRRGWRPWPRQQWLQRLFVTLVLCALACLAWGFFWEPRQLVERDYAFALPHWPRECEGLRLDVVADLHTGSPHNGLDKLDDIVGRLAASDASAVLMAGDYVILSVLGGTYISADQLAPHLKPLTARKPVYAVLGNHDWWKDGHKVRAALESAGVTVLEDQARAAQFGECRVWIVGIGDKWETRHDVAGAFAGVGDDAPTIALTHNPDLFPDIPPRASLTIAGHTHGGQVRLPWIGTPVLPAEQRYAGGYLIEHDKHLFVSTGIGTSILPVRFGVPPEISRLTLRAAAREPVRR
ncbi:metallophosphoesterase [Lysobacter gummosus]|uniref:Metallophosphoesterase n=1 Tax=Lysobacter gummosus TaxID=262324 RepID=A0ABY3XGA8_9GAMM|nr:metallophosphoesterase [Lysobacter gummosus]ALN90087.1 calcineurin-like phosphoesterase family protein [Lysobacter gummosus]UNP30653.1 metallophosphoesterase [Lysobacter gummosus]